jgi:hypothetical protein
MQHEADIVEVVLIEAARLVSAKPRDGKQRPDCRGVAQGGREPKRVGSHGVSVVGHAVILRPAGDKTCRTLKRLREQATADATGSVAQMPIVDEVAQMTPQFSKQVGLRNEPQGERFAQKDIEG